ncbi:MAG: glutamyl-tRNA amidotransferase [Gammaproteobacteria bacterium 13_2_20CM_66_19]|nr:MAG: glutamyl-tRNA amidotransferase [Gammaproteobacteria bacterium 13_2_20CM_66_19]TLY88650.1 MAG: GatB/YqeY domain-containing protein [Gammaproteobacteria bacterium]TLZ01318.1 MAG: GatB/YqeY domain-containing protein [Gammaproteobacteria bacterium]TLZ05479.1 MAG: GatB/YqeY domain-containing protein [Gammaproteobacteria bacterium]TLZ07046.1 MAG: GatB/YqeY domain-containing protein [Gammaproteobacteria bacterium]
MALRERITEDMKSAMRAGDKERLATIRLALAAIKQREVDERTTLDDAQVLAVLEKMIKQRREAIPQFESGGRADLVAKETAEIAVLKGYMPAPLSDAEIDALIGEAIAATGAASIKDMGRVMAAVKPKAQGRAELGAVSARIKQKLS